MLYTKSDYALNKEDPDALVYIDAEGHVLRLTRSQFASDEEFMQWKSWSDQNYHAEEKSTHRYDNHTLSLEALREKGRDIPAAKIPADENSSRIELLRQLQNKLSKTEYRRFMKYRILRKTEQQIAEEEHVTQQQISKSICKASRKADALFRQYEEEQKLRYHKKSHE